MALNQTQIIAKLSENVESVTKKQVKVLLHNFAKIAYKEIKNNFIIPGIGKLVLVKRKARKGVHPATGKPIKIPARTVVKMRVSKIAKEAILGKQAVKKSVKASKKR